MTIYLEEEGDLKLPVDTETLAREAAEAALDEIGCPYEAEVNLLLTMYETPGEFDFLEDRPDCFDPETGRLLLGDIVISKEKVLSQAEEYGHAPRREYAFLVVHSILHLSGYDHMEEEERREMEALQEKILENLQILR